MYHGGRSVAWGSGNPYDWPMWRALRWLTLSGAVALLAAACSGSQPTATSAPDARSTPFPTLSPTDTPPAPPTPFPTVTPRPRVIEEPLALNRIAYIGSDGALYTISPDGTGRVRLAGRVGNGSATENRDPTAHFWPTWSRDNRKLAVSQVTRGEGLAIDSSIFSIATETGEATRLFEAPAGTTQFISDQVPHYLYWSPDSSQLAFLALSGGSFNLHLSPAGEPDASKTIMSGSPFYLSWAGDGRNLFMHVAEGLFLLDLDTDQGPRSLTPRSITFLTPAWVPGDEAISYIARASHGFNVLVLADPGGGGAVSVGDVGERTAFLWAPRGQRVAIADAVDPASLYFESLRILDPATGESLLLAEERILAFMWSPDASKIAFAVAGPAADRLSWKVADSATGEVRKLVDFLPSNDLFVYLLFFDQYANSNSLWSPDSRQLTMSGQVFLNPDGGNKVAPESRVYVLDAEGEEAPRAIAAGSLASWSWG